jgi:hypothetical protein
VKKLRDVYLDLENTTEYGKNDMYQVDVVSVGKLVVVVVMGSSSSISDMEGFSLSFDVDEDEEEEDDVVDLLSLILSLSFCFDDDDELVLKLFGGVLLLTFLVTFNSSKTFNVENVVVQ